ncbi:MAG: hypothetical protein RDV41_00195 [Planctomycetota bacterium]|nr:hypothetical protein [Planctomycetota bacterium]
MADHALLGFLAVQSGGRMLKPEETGRFLEDWKAGDHLAVVEKTTKRSLWDQPYIIIAFAALVAVEWAIRRWSRLI